MGKTRNYGSAKAEFINEIEITTIVKVFLVKCPKCEMEMVTQRYGTENISAVACAFCNCAFNVQWI